MGWLVATELSGIYAKYVHSSLVSRGAPGSHHDVNSQAPLLVSPPLPPSAPLFLPPFLWLSLSFFHFVSLTFSFVFSFCLWTNCMKNALENTRTETFSSSFEHMENVVSVFLCIYGLLFVSIVFMLGVGYLCFTL